MLCLLLFCSLKVYANTCHWQPNCSYRRYFCDFNWTSPETLYIINLFESSLYPPEIVCRLRGQIIKRVLGCRTFSVSHQNNSIWPKWNRTLIIGFACSPQTHLSQSEGLLNKKTKGLLLSSKLTQGIWNSKSQQSSHVCWYSFFLLSGSLCYWVSDTPYQVLTAVAPREQMPAIPFDPHVPFPRWFKLEAPAVCKHPSFFLSSAS